MFEKSPIKYTVTHEVLYIVILSSVLVRIIKFSFYIIRLTFIFKKIIKYRNFLYRMKVKNGFWIYLYKLGRYGYREYTKPWGIYIVFVNWTTQKVIFSFFCYFIFSTYYNHSDDHASLLTLCLRASVHVIWKKR